MDAHRLLRPKVPIAALAVVAEPRHSTRPFDARRPDFLCKVNVRVWELQPLPLFIPLEDGVVSQLLAPPHAPSVLDIP
eukprot:1920578-Rhodomonas_salina.1